MPLNIEQKIDYDPTSKGKHFASEVNTITNVLNKVLSTYGEQENVVEENKLIAALSGVQTDIVYSGTLDTTTVPNILTLTSLSSSFLKKYVGVGKLLFTPNKNNTASVKVRIGTLPSKTIKVDGNELVADDLKANNLYLLDISDTEANLYKVTVDIDPNAVMTNKGILPLDKDLNNILEQGLYIQPNNGLSNKHYPVESSGVLEVIPITATRIMQRYTIENGIVMIRFFNGSTWNDWTDVIKFNNLEIFSIFKNNLNNEDLNTIKATGVYRQEDDTKALESANYPKQISGMLHVIKIGNNLNGNPIILQEYVTSNGRSFTRVYNDTWSIWTSTNNNEDINLKYKDGILTDFNGNVIMPVNVVTVDRTTITKEYVASAGDIQFYVGDIDEDSDISVFYNGVLLASYTYEISISDKSIYLKTAVEEDGHVVMIKVSRPATLNPINVTKTYYDFGIME